MNARFTVPTQNVEAIDLNLIPSLSETEFRDVVIGAVESGERLAALFGVLSANDRLRLLAVMSDRDGGGLAVTSAEVDAAYEALTPECSQAHWFEREIWEQWRVHPKGHPWLKPIRFHDSHRGEPLDADRLPGVTQFFEVHGDAVHEVAVGPVHAGVIEPGHFRFQCYGEEVLHLEISLGYQHRGVERAVIKQPPKRTIHYMETLAGDTTIGHTMAHCQAIEALTQSHAPVRADVLRGVALELERLANHTGDLGALAQDVGFLPTSAYCGRLRGEFLNMSAALCGSRFGRGMVRPGGVGFDVTPMLTAQLIERLDQALADVTQAVTLMLDSSSVQARFEDAGCVSREACEELGLVGVAARACGVERDVRQDLPSGIFRFFQIPVSTWHTGDVLARAYVRWLEVQRSTAFVREQLSSMPEGPIRVTPAAAMPDKLAVSLVEGWRGEICHVAMTGATGRLTAYKIVDPSFHNWMGLAMSLRGQQISDFPLCNKSFNLSYCGHDL